METKRDYFWDNLKAILIFVVVLGHCLGLCTRDINAAEYTDRLIYSFHMPAFIFVSGFWAKRYCVDSKVKAQKAMTLFAYYFIFQTLFSVIAYLVSHKLVISPFAPMRGLWYLLAIFFYYLTVPLIEKFPPWLVLAVSVLFSLLIGAEKKELGNYMAISRMLTFAPFFYAGYYLSKERVEKLRSLNLVLRLLISASLIGATIAALHIKKNALTLTLFFAKKNYASMHHTVTQGLALRSAALVLAAMMTLALLLIVPSKKMIFSVTGKNSLQIFILHMSALVVLTRLKDFNPVINSYPDFLLTILIAASVTAFLSLNIFSYPFKWIAKGVGKLYKE